MTETPPIALLSPEYVEGMVSVKAPPATQPGELVNQMVAGVVSETVSWAPFNSAPEAAANVRLALVKSRGVELACEGHREARSCNVDVFD